MAESAMTRIGKSEAQLDAEAAVRISERPLAESIIDRPLDELIEDHRLLYRADLFHPRLHVRTGNGKSSRSWGDEAESLADGSGMSPIGWTGVEFNGSFLRYIDWDRRDFIEGVRPSHPGQRFPWATARFQQWAECRRSHREHQGRPEWRGSLCYQLVSFVIVREFSLEAACLVLGLTPPRAGRALRQALLYIEAAMDRVYQRQKERAKPLQQRIHWRNEHERHGLPGLHREDCPQCRLAS